MAFTHLAVFDTYNRFGDYGVFETDYLASCITLSLQNRVPAGKRYNVHNINTLSQI